MKVLPLCQILLLNEYQHLQTGDGCAMLIKKSNQLRCFLLVELDGKDFVMVGKDF